jgi:ketosteroid isomerase-like protein
MSQPGLERWRAFFEGFLAGRSEFDPEATVTRMSELWDPEIVQDASEARALDLATVCSGKEAVRRWWQEWFSAWEALEFEYELVAAGDRVVALIDLRMRGRSTGIEVPLGKHAWVATWRDGLMVYGRLYMNQSEALEAVGLNENVETVQRIYEAWAGGDFRAGADALDEHVVFVVRPEFPEFGVFSGPAGVETYMRRLLEQWERLTLEAKHIQTVGDTLLAHVVQHGKGRASGIEGDDRYFMLFTFRGGKIVRIETVMDEAEALEAVGLVSPSA